MATRQPKAGKAPTGGATAHKVSTAVEVALPVRSSGKRRRADELPAPPAQMRPVAAVAAPADLELPTHWSSVSLNNLRIVAVKHADAPVSIAAQAVSDTELLLHQVATGHSDTLTSAQLARLVCGDDCSVSFESKPTAPFPFIIVACPAPTVTRVLQRSSQNSAVSPHDGELLGLRGWLSAAAAVTLPADRLAACADAYMAAFDEHASAAASARETTAATRMTEGGFTLVSHHRRGASAAAEEEADGADADSAMLSDNQKRKKKRGSLLMPDFYKFQRQEDKLTRLQRLRTQFAADKLKIEKLKEERKFKPY